MPLYMDIHTVDPSTTWEDIAQAHFKDMAIQADFNVEYLKYFYNQNCGKLFCLVEAPSAEAAKCVHEQAHGLLAEKLIEVDPDLVDSFMGNVSPNAAGAALIAGSDHQRDSGVRTVMFTDIVGSTEMTCRYGDDAALAMLRVHDKVVRDALAQHGGREIKHTGDGIMAAFLSAACAVRAACSMQAALQEHNRAGAQYPVSIRVGISAGEPVEDHNDLFGSTVQLAARLCAKADPGQILVSDVVAGLCIGKGLKFSEGGECELKGFDRPIETHVVEMVC
jgi:class 3 adenylate cyclase